MAKYIVNIKSGESLEVTPENSAQVEMEYNANPSLYRLEADDSDITLHNTPSEKQDSIQQWRFEGQKLMDEANRTSKNPRMREDQVSGIWDALGTGIARGMYPIASNIAEQGGSEEDIQRSAGIENAMNLGMAIPSTIGMSNALKQMLLYGGGTYGAREAGGQEGSILESGIAGGIPLMGGAYGVVSSKIGDKVKGRAVNQLYSSIVPDKNAKFGTNPITKIELEEQILKTGKIPIFRSEATAFDKLSTGLHSDIKKLDAERRASARDITETVPVYYKTKPEVSHMEAVPSKDSPVNEIPLYSDSDIKNQQMKAKYTKAKNKVLRDPEYVYMDLPDVPDYLPPEAPNGSGVKNWDLEKVVEEPEKKLRSAYSDAKRRIMVDFKNNKDVANKIIASLDEWYYAQNAKVGGVKAVKAIDMVTDLNDVAKTFDKTLGATSPHELAKSYMATEINKYIGKLSPELKQKSKEIGKKMSLYVPIKERARATAVNSPVGSGIRSELSRYINRSPQGAQLKYGIGATLANEYPKARGVSRVVAEKGNQQGENYRKNKMSQYGK